MFKYVCLLLILSFSFSANAFNSDIVLANGNIVEVYDGDTFFVHIPGTHSVFGERLGIRLRGVDTPEMRSSCRTPDGEVDVDARSDERAMARVARDFVADLLVKADTITLSNLTRASRSFRVVADVNVDGVDLATVLLSEAHAVRIEEKRFDWCVKF